MPIANVNGIALSYHDQGAGEPVLLIMGSGAGGRAWHLHQVPALLQAGYRVITFDNRGIASSSPCPEGFALDDLVRDTAGLMEFLGLDGCRLVGTSLGAMVAQELSLNRPDLVQQQVLMATRGRNDRLRNMLSHAEMELHDSGVAVPPRYLAVVRAMQNLSARTLDDDANVGDWLELFEVTSGSSAGIRAQLALDTIADRLAAYRSISVATRVLAFTDDLIAPPHLGREVAEAIPGAEFELIGGCGHYGYLEDPEAVNKSILEFFGGLR